MSTGPREKKRIAKEKVAWLTVTAKKCRGTVEGGSLNVESKES